MMKHTNCKTKKKTNSIFFYLNFEQRSFISNNLTFPVPPSPPSNPLGNYISNFLGVILISDLKAQQIITKKHDPAMNKISKVI